MATTDSNANDRGIDDKYSDCDADELRQWYDDELDATESVHTDLEVVPEVSDIELANGTVMEGRSLSFLIERAMLDPNCTVRPAER